MDGQRPQNSNIREVARSLTSMLGSHINELEQMPDQQRQAGPQAQQQTPPTQQAVQGWTNVLQHQPSSIGREMTRSFPGFFNRGPARGKKRFFPQVAHSSGKMLTLQFYMVNKNTDRTPPASSELTLLLAGMGRRTVTVPEAADHSEISRLLTNQYPKLEKISGGWLLYKALGGSGQRKLAVVPPQAEGYDAQYLKKSSGGGKNVIYILPLQDEVDTSPLPIDAHEFSKMPKAECRLCRTSMPLQILAIHVKTCMEHSSGDDIFVHEKASPGVMSIADTAPAESTSRTTQQTNMSPASATCPVCELQYPVDYLEVHASGCGDSEEETQSTVEVLKSPVGGIENLDDIIRTISDAVITDDKTFNITVSRNNMMERGLAQWQRQKKSSPSYPIKVTFLGEAGVDTGALRKEFFTGMVAGFEERFFESGTHGGRPKYSLSDLDKGHFRTVGEIMAASLAQGGPPPNYLMLWCYRFLCTGSIDFEHMEKNDVGDEEYLDLLSRVEAATDTSIPDLTNEILNCGYTGQITIGRREEITRAIVLHANLRLLPMLLQIRDGLKLYGLSDLMAKYPDVCQPLFVPGLEMTADADFVLSVCQAEYSETGTNQEKVEVMVMNHLQDFLQELEQESVMERDALPSLSPKTFLQWITGQGHLPVLKEERKHFNVSIKFNHHCEKDFGDHRICYPCVAACSNTITLPVKHMTSYDEFKTVLVEAFHLGQEFSRV